MLSRAEFQSNFNINNYSANDSGQPLRVNPVDDVDYSMILMDLSI